MPDIRKIFKFSALMLAFALLAFVSAIVTMKAVTYGRTVVVPDVSGAQLSYAINAFRQDGLDIKVDREEYHPSVPAGAIITQNPLPGSTVKRGRNVSVVVSLGSVEVPAPVLTGELFRRAQTLLKQLGLTLGEVSRVASDAGKEIVVAQQPYGQTVLQKGAKVDLLVSDGPRPATFVTPDLVGKTQSEATEILKPLSVAVNPTGKGGLIATQDPKPGYPVVAGAGVNVTFGAAKPAATPAPPGQKPALLNAPMDKPAAHDTPAERRAPKTPAPEHKEKARE